MAVFTRTPFEDHVQALGPIVSVKTVGVWVYMQRKEADLDWMPLCIYRVLSAHTHARLLSIYISFCPANTVFISMQNFRKSGWNIWCSDNYGKALKNP